MSQFNRIDLSLSNTFLKHRLSRLSVWIPLYNSFKMILEHVTYFKRLFWNSCITIIMTFYSFFVDKRHISTKVHTSTSTQKRNLYNYSCCLCWCCCGKNDTLSKLRQKSSYSCCRYRRCCCCCRRCCCCCTVRHYCGTMIKLRYTVWQYN